MARPRKVIDYPSAEKLAYLQCTVSEIAEFLGVSTRTLERNAQFCRIHKKGLESGKSSLRRLQWKAAEGGNTTMLIWLGKQYLGQRDRQEVTGEGGGPQKVEISVVSEKAKQLTEDILQGKRSHENSDH
jgi:hypothetical protein